jgi:hypothetical protein
MAAETGESHSGNEDKRIAMTHHITVRQKNTIKTHKAICDFVSFLLSDAQFAEI